MTDWRKAIDATFPTPTAMASSTNAASATPAVDVRPTAVNAMPAEEAGDDQHTGRSEAAHDPVSSQAADHVAGGAPGDEQPERDARRCRTRSPYTTRIARPIVWQKAKVGDHGGDEPERRMSRSQRDPSRTSAVSDRRSGASTAAGSVACRGRRAGRKRQERGRRREADSVGHEGSAAAKAKRTRPSAGPANCSPVTCAAKRRPLALASCSREHLGKQGLRRRHESGLERPEDERRDVELR